ncbi:MAG: hypothetical protein HYZ37_00840 [Candidatus Solibacter usitatus]|nr:hypothetical protein [Candidatus Solibacter usitatus]
MERFFQALAEFPPSSVLDLGGANQANVSFLTNLGHGISPDNVLHYLDRIWHNPELSASRRREEFFDHALNYHAASFNGALVWDTLEFLPEDLLDSFIKQLHILLNPGAPMLILFHGSERESNIQSWTYRIASTSMLQLAPLEVRTRSRYYSNTAIERIFEGFRRVSFFLAHNQIREVLVIR